MRTALGEKLKTWEGGRLVVHIVDMPIKCPVAPLEFTFLADSFFREHGIRDQVEIVYVTPLPGAFTKPIASRYLGGMLDERKVELESDFMVERIDPEAKTVVSYDEREVPFDLLVTIPLNMGADFVARSGLGDDLNYVKVDKETFLSTQHDNIFAIGDASNIPTSKAGSVAHFAVDIFAHNFVRHIDGLPMDQRFDGHANCFIESGDGKGMLIDFNYDTEPMPGKYPLPGIGPFSLLKETELNHWGKLMFRWIYWNVLLPGKELPLAGPDVHGRQGDSRGHGVMTTVTTSVTTDERLDILTAQVQVMADELRREREQRERWGELVQDMAPVTSEAFAAVSRELEDLSDDVTVEDLARFGRTMARALPTMEALLAQLESLSDAEQRGQSRWRRRPWPRSPPRCKELRRQGLLRVRPQRRRDRRPRRDVVHRGGRRGARRQRRLDPQHGQRDDAAGGHDAPAAHRRHRAGGRGRTREPPSLLALFKQMRDPQTRRGLGRCTDHASLGRRGQACRLGLTPRRKVSTMPVTTINGRDIHVDDEGFMTEYAEWDEDLAKVLAANIAIDLTDDHWKVIKFVREDYQAQGETPTIRRVSTAGGVDTKKLFTLFPKKPAKKMSYIAGVPKPHGCV